jgi:hypothetical protein
MLTVGLRRYVAVLLPYDRSFKIDEQAFRRYVCYFADDKRFAREGGLCINPEAGEIFYMTREEKRRVLEIAMEEAHGKLPIIAGTWALTTEETVETAKDCKALGVDGIFVTPPGGAQDVPTTVKFGLLAARHPCKNRKNYKFLARNIPAKSLARQAVRIEPVSVSQLAQNRDKYRENHQNFREMSRQSREVSV